MCPQGLVVLVLGVSTQFALLRRLSEERSEHAC